MKAPMKKALRKWVVGVGCTLSIAAMLQQAKTSAAFQAQSSNTTPDTSIQTPDTSEDDSVIQEWQGQRRERPGQGDVPGDSSSFGSRSDSGFQSRSGHS